MRQKRHHQPPQTLSAIERPFLRFARKLLNKQRHDERRDEDSRDDGDRRGDPQGKEQAAPGFLRTDSDRLQYVRFFPREPIAR